MFAVKRPKRAPWRRSGNCLTTNISVFTGLPQPDLIAYLTAVKAYLPRPGQVWMRMTRYGIPATSSPPNWSSAGSYYWPLLYKLPPAADILTGVKLMFEPILWVRQTTGVTPMCQPCAAPNFFGRDLNGNNVVPDAENTWRRDIRANLDHLVGTDVGTTGDWQGALVTNSNVALLLSPNEIDLWSNARIVYVADAECSGGSAPTEATRAGVANLAGTAGLYRFLTRIYDHLRHVSEWARENRPDVGIAAPPLIQVARNADGREFTIYDLLNFAPPGGSPGGINDICDVHQIHPHNNQGRFIDPFTGAVPSDSSIIPYHYWKANLQLQVQRYTLGLPDNTRPLWATETGRDLGLHTEGRTDPTQIRRLGYGQLVNGMVYWGCIGNNFYVVSRSSSTNYNVMGNDNVPWGSSGQLDINFVADAFDTSNMYGSIAFVAKTWTDYWRGWQVYFNQSQTPIAGGPTVCPFPEWNRVEMSANQLRMLPGGRNCAHHRVGLGVGEHIFRVDVASTGSASSGVMLVIAGHDKLNGLNQVRSPLLSGIVGERTIEVRFTPRQHKNPRLPDPADCLLMIEHNGQGTVTARNPRLIRPGESDPFPFIP